MVGPVPPPTPVVMTLPASMETSSLVGYNAALCCAPDARTAECLALILTQMFPQSPNCTLAKSFNKGQSSVKVVNHVVDFVFSSLTRGH